MAGFKDLIKQQPIVDTNPNDIQEKIKPIINISETVLEESNVNEGQDIITLDNISLTFKTPTTKNTVFQNFNFKIQDFVNQSQFISLMGQSGCGKSTILNLIAGLIEPDSGKVQIDGMDLKRDQSVPLIFQNYSSYPWRNVFDNVAIPLELYGVSKKERKERTMQMLKLVGLEQHAYKYPNQLSGGQKQRVAIARSLNCNSKILLLDEASSGLDIKMKRELQDTLVNLCYNHTDFNRTFVNVGHNIEENVYMSNRIYILTANPCTIHKVIDINFDRRTPSIRKTIEFHNYVDYIDNIMNEIC